MIQVFSKFHFTLLLFTPKWKYVGKKLCSLNIKGSTFAFSVKWGNWTELTGLFCGFLDKSFNLSMFAQVFGKITFINDVWLKVISDCCFSNKTVFKSFVRTCQHTIFMLVFIMGFFQWQTIDTTLQSCLKTYNSLYNISLFHKHRPIPANYHYNLQG